MAVSSGRGVSSVSDWALPPSYNSIIAPDVFHKYQAMLAVKAAGIIYDDLLDLSGKDMALILTEVKNFLF